MWTGLSETGFRVSEKRDRVDRYRVSGLLVSREHHVERLLEGRLEVDAL